MLLALSTTATGVLMIEGFLLLFRLWALFKCISRPAWAFDNAGSSKGVWLVVLIVFLFVPVLGFFVALWYLFSTDRKVRNQLQLGGGIGFPGGPPQY
jgi:hypothetical protein